MLKTYDNIKVVFPLIVEPILAFTSNTNLVREANYFPSYFK